MKIIQPKTNAAFGTALRNSNSVRAVVGGVQKKSAGRMLEDARRMRCR